MERSGDISGALHLGALSAYRGASAAEHIVAMRKFMREALDTGMVRGTKFYLDQTINITSIQPLHALVLEGCEFILLSKLKFDSIINISGDCKGLTLSFCHYTRLKPAIFKKL